MIMIKARKMLTVKRYTNAAGLTWEEISVQVPHPI